MGTQGKSGFYGGRIGKAISEVIQEHGGVLTVDDLTSHETTYDNPISTTYKGFRVWEIPPNGQGICALMTLNILEGIDLQCKSSFIRKLIGKYGGIKHAHSLIQFPISWYHSASSYRLCIHVVKNSQGIGTTH